MIRFNKRVESYPSKSVIEDVITRIGPAVQGIDFTPFDGVRFLIEEQFKGIARDNFDLEEFLDYIENVEHVDFDPSRVVIPEKLEDMELQESYNPGWTRLEDMLDNQEPLVKYVRNLLIGYKINAKSPYRTKVVYTLSFDDDETGETTKEGELVTVEKDYDLEVFYQTIEEVPYLLKQIHERSKVIHAHLFSFLRAYVILMRDKKSVNMIKPIDFSYFDLYRMKSDGTIERKFRHEDDQKGVDYPFARRLILGEFPEDVGYKACMRLLTCLEILGVDIADENPLEYNNDMMRRLTCTYLPKNEEYYKDYGNIDEEVKNALLPENIFKVGNKFTVGSDKEDLTDNDFLFCVRTSIDIAKSLNPNLFNGWSVKREEIIRYVKEICFRKNGQTDIDDNLFTTYNGFFYYKNKLLKRKSSYVNRLGGSYVDMIFHEAGLIIPITATYKNTLYVTVEDALARLENIDRGVAYETGWNSL